MTSPVCKRVTVSLCKASLCKVSRRKVSLCVPLGPYVCHRTHAFTVAVSPTCDFAAHDGFELALAAGIPQLLFAQAQEGVDLVNSRAGRGGALVPRVSIGSGPLGALLFGCFDGPVLGRGIECGCGPHLCRALEYLRLRLNSTAQPSIEQHNRSRYSTAQRRTARPSIILHDTAGNSTARHSTTEHA